MWVRCTKCAELFQHLKNNLKANQQKKQSKCFLTQKKRKWNPFANVLKCRLWHTMTMTMLGCKLRCTCETTFAIDEVAPGGTCIIHLESSHWIWLHFRNILCQAERQWKHHKQRADHGQLELFGLTHLGLQRLPWKVWLRSNQTSGLLIVFLSHHLWR